MQRHLFLDLEDTVITPVSTCWFDAQLLNIYRVRNFIEEWKPDAIHLFSFALHNIKELSAFNQGVRPRLEAALGRKISMTPTMDQDFLPLCRQAQGRAPSGMQPLQLLRLLGKQQAFHMFLREQKFKQANPSLPLHVALVDDTVYNEDFFWPKENVRGTIRHVHAL